LLPLPLYWDALSSSSVNLLPPPLPPPPYPPRHPRAHPLQQQPPPVLALFQTQALAVVLVQVGQLLVPLLPPLLVVAEVQQLVLRKDGSLLPRPCPYLHLQQQQQLLLLRLLLWERQKVLLLKV
jgi:hypothetical protein